MKTQLRIFVTTFFVTFTCAEYLIHKECMNCIYEASFHHTHRSKVFTLSPCGPFHISEKYWNSVKDNNAIILSDYTACVKNIACASEVVRRYVIKKLNEKHIHKKPDAFECWEYAEAHAQNITNTQCGFYRFVSKKSYWKYFNFCYDELIFKGKLRKSPDLRLRFG